jgi:transcription antitermination factor NusG
VEVAEAATGRWFVIRTRSRQEKALSLDLAARGIDHFLPLSRVVRYHGRRKAVVMEPLFPGYLFMRGEIDQAYTAERTGRVAQVLAAPDQGRLREELRNIRLAQLRGAELTVCDRIECGVLVEVASGPLRGIRGTVEAAVRDDRLVLNVELITRAAQLEIDRTLLRRVQ